jgi:hypothetical protein
MHPNLQKSNTFVNCKDVHIGFKETPADRGEALCHSNKNNELDLVLTVWYSSSCGSF